jgi:hypothetical protein
MNKSTVVIGLAMVVLGVLLGWLHFLLFGLLVPIGLIVIVVGLFRVGKSP